MNPIPQTLPVSDLRFKQAELLDNLAKAPVVLTRQGKAAAVLVDPEQWNALLERLELLDDSVTALQAKLEILTGEDESVSWDSVKAELVDGVPTRG
jgi:prevent-host-death family protein